MTWRSIGTRNSMLVLCGLALIACSQELEGPKPAVEPASKSAKPPPVDPEIICRDQLRTRVTLHGEHLSPVAIAGCFKKVVA
jgi:hypothetical protein